MQNIKTYLFFFLLITITSTELIAQDILMLKNDGKVLIGDPNVVNTTANYKLFVQDGILTERIKVALKSTSNWSDHAFDHTPTLEQVEQCIAQNSHLHDMPSAELLVKSGYEVQHMDAKLLAQIEWLWQHTVRIQKEKQTLEEELSQLKNVVNQLAAKVASLEKK